MKACPFCAEEIQDAAIVCKHCGRDLPPPMPEWEVEARALVVAGKPIDAIQRVRAATKMSLSDAGALVAKWETRPPGPAGTDPHSMSSPNVPPGTTIVSVKPKGNASGCLVAAGISIAWLAVLVASNRYLIVAFMLVLAAIVAATMYVIGRFRPSTPYVSLVHNALQRRGAWMALAVVGSASALGLVGGIGQYTKTRSAAAAQREAAEAADRQRQQTLSRLPELEKTLRSQVAAEQWDQAAKTHAEIKGARPDDPILAETLGSIAAGQAAAKAKQIEGVRIAKVKGSLEYGQKVVADKRLCNTPKEIADVWGGLKQVKRSDAVWSAASSLVPRLEACRKGAEAELTKGMRSLMVAQREAWREKVEKLFLDQGMNMDVTLSGTFRDHARLKWALMSKVTVHKLTGDDSMREGSFLHGLQKIGFRKVEFSDGWNYGVVYTLHPSDESGAGGSVLQGLGLGTKLTLAAP